MSEVGTLLSSISASAVVSALTAFFAQNWIAARLNAAIKNQYDQRLETHKAQLLASNQIEVEKFKAELQLAASERGIRLTRVFERTVDAIAGTYERLLAFHDAVGRYTSVIEYSTDPPKSERRQALPLH
jgi:hypothetical protein